MGADASKGALAEDPNVRTNLVEGLRDATQGKGDLDKYKEAWSMVEERRSRADNLSQLRKDAAIDFDKAIIEQYKVMAYIKYAFRHSDTDWREAGIKIARSFFHLPEARQKLANLDFVGSLLLITLPDDKGDDASFEDGEDDKQQAREKQQEEDRQLLAAEIVCEMAEYNEFLPSLCATNVLNFLCIVLNQVKGAVEIITHTFVKLSKKEENLAVLMEGAVGDILESFFKTVPFERNKDDDEEQEQRKKDIKALAHCSHTLATLIKYNHQCQVDLGRIIAVFENAKKEEYSPDNVHLLAEMARLFYWVCRRSPDVVKTLETAAVDFGNNIDRVLQVLVQLWMRCVETNEMIEMSDGLRPWDSMETEEKFKEFMVDDIEKIPLDPEKDAWDLKKYYARQRLCYTNCVLWVLLPNSNLRWKMRKMDLSHLYLAFSLTDESEFMRVILSTVRHILDQPEAQECYQMTDYFGTELLKLLDEALVGKVPHQSLRLLVDSICILAMAREMQEKMSDPANDVYRKLEDLVKIVNNRGIQDYGDKRRMEQAVADRKSIELAVLRTESEIAIHPSNRMEWVTKASVSVENYPPRAEFTRQLERRIKEPDENFKTIASLLLTIFHEHKFKRPASEIETTFTSVLDWWRVNTTARYEEEKEATEAAESGIARASAEASNTVPLAELLQRAFIMKEQRRALTSMEAMPYCAPHECVLALSLFSRLALEPKFKRFFYNDALQPLLGCVCVGIWAEAREAAAVLANLMWLPDLNEERLVCWLKFDGPKCITVDAANVLLPVKVNNPRPADIGKGMYKSTWGVQFVEGTCVALHPDGLQTNKVPGMLTCAAPSHTFEHTTREYYQWLEPGPENPDGSERERYEPDRRHFTLTCWFYWPLVTTSSKHNVLVQSCSSNPMSQVYLDCSDPSKHGVWTLTNEDGRRQPLQTPELSKGWHMLSLVSANNKSFKGTKFFLDDWHCAIPNFFVKNEFYMVGNDAGHGGKKPFGLLCDFRIYARTLEDKEIKAMVMAKDMDSHPDKIVRKLADYDAATILAQRLDVPDSATECLRALGSLATLRSQRAKIFSVCGREVLKMLNSPLPMVHRQAARLLNNIT